MTLRDFLTDTVTRFRRHRPTDALLWTAGELLNGISQRIGRVVNYGTPLWERDWEVLVILDGCRYDLFTETAPDFPWLTGYSPVYSPASHSEEWMRKHFTAEYADIMSRTSLISANVYTHETTSNAAWYHLDEVWKDAWDEEAGVVRPETVTDAAIAHWRESNPEKMIVWYMQPHWPFLEEDHKGWEVHRDGTQFDFEMKQQDDPIWHQYRKGKISFEDLWSGYQDNLRLVLEEVDELRRNLDADSVAVTSDHANLVGELGLYGHTAYLPHPTLKRVPWVHVSAEDSGDRDGGVDRRAVESTVEERLEDLGYV